MSFTEESDKYPPHIQRLFAPKLPIPFYPPVDHAPEARRTIELTPISHLKSKYTHYIEQELPELSKSTPEKSDSQLRFEKVHQRKSAQQQSFARQLDDWNNPELLQQHEQEFMKDPYRTVFIARLDYSLSEIEISKHFSRFGPIESVRIIRNTTNGKSRGYGFIVFERAVDAKVCVQELAPTGIKIPTSNSSTPRTILVDIERGRLTRNWKPTRLGGGLGGRHYTKTNSKFSNNASAAATGRRMNLPSQDQNFHKFQKTLSSTPSTGVSYGSSNFNTNTKPRQDPRSDKRIDRSVRDKYAKYSNYDSSSSQRSSNSIRQRE